MTLSRNTLELRDTILTLFGDFEDHPHRRMIRLWLQNIHDEKDARTAHIAYDDIWLRAAAEAERKVVDEEESWAFNDSQALGHVMMAVEAWLVLASHPNPELYELGKKPTAWDHVAGQDYEAKERENRRRERVHYLLHAATEDRVKASINAARSSLDVPAKS